MSHPQDENGVISGENTISIKRGSKNLFLIIHGFTSSPSRYRSLIGYLEKSIINMDIFCPLLPFHGRDFDKFKEFSHQRIRSYVENIIKEKQHMYDKIIILAGSYGATVLVDVLNNTSIAPKSKIIFSAPAFFLKDNTKTNRILLKISDPFMDYCTSPLLGCYSHYIAYAHNHEDMVHVDRHGAKPIKGVYSVFQNDLDFRDYFSNFSRDLTVIMSKNDDTVNHKMVSESCAKNNHCKMITLSSGGHHPGWSKEKNKYRTSIEKIARNFISTSN